MKYGFIASWGMPDEVLQQTRAAERAGWDGVFTWDGICVGPVPTFDAWSMLGAMAVVTQRVQLGAMVFALPRRKPWEFARQSITVDHLSNGRLVLPVALGAADDAGVGGVNTDPADRRARAERLDESLTFLDHAWSGEPFVHTGAHFQAAEMVFLPTPAQQPRIPIWCVAQWPSEKSLARAARYDGIIVSARDGDLTPETVGDVADWMRQHRDSDTPFEIVVEGTSEPGSDNRLVREFEDAGATWFIESRWEESDTPSSLLARAEAGPPTTD